MPYRFFLGLVLSLTLVALTGCSGERALMSQVKVCTQLDEGRCQQSIDRVMADTPEFYATTLVSGIPKQAPVIFRWEYTADHTSVQEIKQISLTPEHDSQILTSTLSKLNAAWPAGYYRVTVTVPALPELKNSADFRVFTTQSE